MKSLPQCHCKPEKLQSAPLQVSKMLTFAQQTCTANRILHLQLACIVSTQALAEACHFAAGFAYTFAFESFKRRCYQHLY